MIRFWCQMLTDMQEVNVQVAVRVSLQYVHYIW